MDPARRIVASWSRLVRTLLALLLAFGVCGGGAVAAGGQGDGVDPAAGVLAVELLASDRTAATDALGDIGPTSSAIAAVAEDHEECALVEGVPETSEDDVAVAVPWPEGANGCTARACSRADAGTWRRSPARRKCARGPPPAAN